MFTKKITDLLEYKGYLFEVRNINNGKQFMIANRCIINVYNTGSISIQGRNKELIKEIKQLLNIK